MVLLGLIYTELPNDLYSSLIAYYVSMLLNLRQSLMYANHRANILLKSIDFVHTPDLY